MSALPVKDGAAPAPRRSWTPVRIGGLIARLALAAVFVWAAIPKLLEPASFAEAVANYHLVPDSLVGVVAALVPAMELVIAVALVVGWGARGAAVAAMAMLTVFTIGMVQAMVRGIDLECGCFGAALKAEVGWGTVLRNVALVGLGGAVLVLGSRRAQQPTTTTTTTKTAVKD